MNGSRFAPVQRAPRRLALASLSLLLVVTALAGCDGRRYLNGWAPYWSPSTSGTSFSENAPLFEEVSPFWYTARDGPGTIAAQASPSLMDPIVEAARTEGVPVLPSITDGHGAGGLAAILADPTTRAAHVKAIVDLVLAEGYDGIDLDYEGFAFSDGRDTWPSTRPNWVAFVRALGAELHAHEKLLSVTVPPIWADGAQGYTVYAWEEIGASVDRLRIMNYDWSFSRAGPGSPIWWVNDTIEYAASVVPISKVQIGVPTYGREWTVDTRGTCPADMVPGMVSRTLRDITDLLAAQGITPSRDTASGEMVARYTRTIETHVGTRPATTRPPAGNDTRLSPDTIEKWAKPLATAVRLSTCVITRELWYPDPTALAARARAATDAGAGVTIWALGYETAAEWAAFGAVGSELSGPVGTAPVGEFESAGRSSKRVAVTGWAFDPEGDLPIDVRVRVTDVDDASSVATMVLARTARRDVAAARPGAGEFHGFDTTVRAVSSGTPSGRYDVCIEAVGRYGGPAVTDLGCRRVRFP